MSSEIRDLIRQMASENGWGAPRIHGELRMLGTAERWVPADGVLANDRARITHTATTVVRSSLSPWCEPLLHTDRADLHARLRQQSAAGLSPRRRAPQQ